MNTFYIVHGAYIVINPMRYNFLIFINNDAPMLVVHGGLPRRLIRNLAKVFVTPPHYAVSFH